MASRERLTKRFLISTAIALFSATLFLFPVAAFGFDISGTVSEDVNGDAGLGDAVVRNNVTVVLYQDGGDGQPDGVDDIFVNSTTTDIGGNYTFTALGAGTYWVVVDSKTVTPSAGLKGGFTQGDVWPEQTYGVAGAWCDDGTGAPAQIGAAGACYGGQVSTVSDNASALASAEHVTRVVVVASNVTGVDSAFSFAPVVNSLAGDAQDDDVGANRTVQGSLRQLIQNANAIIGANTMRFVPAGPTNATDGGGNNWWRIQVTQNLTAITDMNTTVDGTAYDRADGVTVRNTNSTLLGFVGAVGLGADALPGTADEPTLSGVQGPELEIVNDRATNVVDIGLDLQANDLTVRRIASYGFGSSSLFKDANIRVGVNGGGMNFTGILIEDNVIGSGAASFTDPGAAARSAVNDIAVFGADTCTIQGNLIGYAGRFGIFLSDTAVGWTVQGNEIRANALTDAAQDGMDIGNSSSGATVSGNLFALSDGGGIDSFRGLGNNLIENNTFSQNGQAGTEPAAMRIFGADNIIRLNDIQDNVGPGILIVSDISQAGSPSIQNRISQNRFTGNGSNAIDLLALGGDASLGDGITLNDASTDAQAGNIGLDYPVIASAVLIAGTTTVTGTTCANCDIEVYEAVAGAGDTLTGTDYGEGVEFVGSTTADGAGAWSVGGITSLIAGDDVSAITMDASNNTSEFGANVTVVLGGTLTLSDHDAGQIVDQFGTTTPVTSELFAFKLSTTGVVTVDNIRVHFSTTGGVANGDVTSGELHRDNNNNGVIDGGDTPIQTGVTPTGGFLAFTSLGESPGAGTNYIVQAIVANLLAGDVTTFSMETADIDEVESGVSEGGSAGFAIHTFDSVSGGDVFYSVGTSRATSTDLKTGGPTITITNGTATFSVAQTGNVGVGDEINYGAGSLAYIKSLLSQTQFVVHTANGGVPANVTDVTVNSIMRAFDTLANAESNSGTGSYLGNFDLTAVNATLTWVAYNDGAFTAGAAINSYTTDATHFITLTVAGSSQVASGTSQRHNGTAGTGVVLDGQDTDQGIRVQDDYTTVEWFEFKRNRGGATAVSVETRDATNILLQNLLIYDFDDAANFVAGIKGEDNSSYTVRNSIIYDGDSAAIRNQNVTTTGTVENCTLYGSQRGVLVDAGTMTVINTIALGNTTADFQGTMTGSHNMSTDGTASRAFGADPNAITGASSAVEFVDDNFATADLHLAATAQAINAGTNLSGTFTTDIDEETRGAAWDMGADESTITVNYRSIGTNTGNLHPSGTASVPIGSTTVTFSVALPQPTAIGAIGEGDNLTIEGEILFILSRDSDFQVTLQSPATAPHTDVAFTITRAYNTLQAWEDPCAATPCLALSGGGRGGDLVADNRLEVGVAYKDGPFVPPYATANSALAINGSTTDADHFMWLTVAPGQRHDGTAGTGVVVDGQGATKFGIQDLDNFSRVEWLELVGFFTDVVDSGFASIVTVGTNALYQNLLIHDFLDLDPGDTGHGIRVSVTPGPWSFTVRNSIFYDGDSSAIRIDESSSSITVENCTIFSMEQFGVSLGSSGGMATVTNTISMNHGSDSFNVAGGALTQSYNISSDGTAAGTGSLPNRDFTASTSPGAPPQGQGWVMFQNLTGGTEDFHLQDNLAQNDALQAGQDLSASFSQDIDGGNRVAPWDIGADEVEATTAVELVSFEAFGVNGAVELRWETGSELDNLGFHLYRSLTEEGSYEQITASVIPGLGSSPEGAKYAYRDSGLTNGVTYFYQLEDIETTGVTELHGSVSATPTAEVVAEGGTEGEEEGTVDEDLGDLSSRITYGDPSANELRVRRRGRRWMELELITEGFYAIPQDDGSVLLEVPGFEDFGGPDLPDVPVYRTWQDVLAGRKVRLSSVNVNGLAEFASLRPSSSELIVVASGDGTVQTSRRRRKRRRPPHIYYPEKWARLMNVGFQGAAKKALVEMAPLRWDATAERLVLARRLVVRFSFKGKDKAEVKLGKSHREVGSHANRNVLARLAVTEPGLYAVSYESIFGKRKKAIKTSGLRLSRQGEPVAFFVSPNRKKFKRKSKLYFLSDGASLNPYGHEAVYELESSSAGMQMGAVDGTPSGASTSFYWKTVKREENLLYQAAFEGEEDIWQWDWLFGPMTNGYPFEVTNLSPASESSKLRVWLHGASDFPEDPDHHVRLYINGILINDTWWDGETPHFVEAELGLGLLQEGENTLEIEEAGDTEAQYSMVMLDRFEVSYPAQLLAEEGELKGRFSESGVATITGPRGQIGALSPPAVAQSTEGEPWGWGPKALIFDVTDPEPRRLTGASVVPDGLSFRVESGRHYLLTDAVKIPEVRAAQSTGLKKAWSRAEYLVIGPREFLTAAEPLLAHRRNEGLISGAIATEDIFDEFGYGEATPESIRDFLSYVYHHWSEPALRYVVLLGDSTYDTKDYLATGVKSQVPVKIVKTRYIWTASDPWFGAINGDDILPDVAVGRLPAASTEEAQRLVAKILAYETREGDPLAPTVLITDNPDRAGNFDTDAEEIASTIFSGAGVEKIYLSQLGTAGAQTAILDAFDQGASLMSYMGHGAIHLWANENLFNIWRVDSLSSQEQQPLLLTMNCLNGYFHFPYFNSLSEELLKAEGKGVIAAFSPSGLSLNSPAHRFHKAVLDQVVNQQHQRLGDAILAGQAAYAQTGAFPELLSIYHLLGDPALRLR